MQRSFSQGSAHHFVRINLNRLTFVLSEDVIFLNLSVIVYK